MSIKNLYSDIFMLPVIHSIVCVVCWFCQMSGENRWAELFWAGHLQSGTANKRNSWCAMVSVPGATPNNAWRCFSTNRSFSLRRALYLCQMLVEGLCCFVLTIIINPGPPIRRRFLLATKSWRRPRTQCLLQAHWSSVRCWPLRHENFDLPLASSKKHRLELLRRLDAVHGAS